MYNKRIRIFVAVSALLLLACTVRLAQMQLSRKSLYREKIAALKLNAGQYQQFRTIRGRILDRKGISLAAEQPSFQLHINYQFCRFWDRRVTQAMMLAASSGPNPEKNMASLQKEIETKLAEIHQVIDKCEHFGLRRADAAARIEAINEQIWNQREFLAWRRNYLDDNLVRSYGSVVAIPRKIAMEDFERREPNADRRIELTAAVDIPEMQYDWPLLKLRTDTDIFTAQLEFMNTDGVRVLPTAERIYPYRLTAAQTIGWVGPFKEHSEQLFRDDKLASYRSDELSGQSPGAEYVCEGILRGRRGEEVHDIDRQLVDRTETQLGRDVHLSLDIELQKRIEDYLTDRPHEPNCGPGFAAVVIDVNTADILALVSLPNYDLNNVRQNYTQLVNDPNRPMINRTINAHYPPGSVVKPLILIAALESGKITPDEVISCPARAADTGWPSCWYYNKNHWTCHDDLWQGEAGNNARNAVKGSCNIYFSRLADRIEPAILQQWLFSFGYGHNILPGPQSLDNTRFSRTPLQSAGIISSTNPDKPANTASELPALLPSDRRWFGIGHGNLRATPLQVANSMATIARGGLYKTPRLFIEDTDAQPSAKSLGISPQTLRVVRDGMNAVVNELNGTANKAFVGADFSSHAVKVYGKTGSTESPETAWFAGFAEDGKGRGIALAILVENGQSGADDAAPLAREIIGFCIDADYIGIGQIFSQAVPPAPSPP